MTLVGPGMVDTPFLDESKPGLLHTEDIARSVVYALSQPAHVDLHELVVPAPPRE